MAATNWDPNRSPNRFDARVRCATDGLLITVASSPFLAGCSVPVTVDRRAGADRFGRSAIRPPSGCCAEP